MSSTEPGWAAVILAAGYGSRLQKDIENDPSKQFESLLGQPKALLPVGGVPLLDHWLRAFRESGGAVGPVIVVTNELFYRQFAEWAVSRGLGRNAVVNDGTTANENRLGAWCAAHAPFPAFLQSNLNCARGSPLTYPTVSPSACTLHATPLPARQPAVPRIRSADLQLALEQKADIIGNRDILVVAGDTLFFQDFSLSAFLGALPPHRSGVVTYQVRARLRPRAGRRPAPCPAHVPMAVGRASLPPCNFGRGPCRSRAHKPPCAQYNACRSVARAPLRRWARTPRRASAASSRSTQLLKSCSSS